MFGVIVVSGQEGVMKPDPRIYEILLERAGLAAADCVFIDDPAQRRARAPSAWTGSTSPAPLEALKARGLLR
jgi:2-haloacid dehalogenase